MRTVGAVGTGLIYAAIVVAWAAYLVPLWLRRHDEAVAARSVDRFSHAVRVLARRPSPGAAESGDTESDARATMASSGTVATRAARAGAARRRRTLLVLVLLLSAVAVLTVLDVLMWWSILVPVGSVLVFLAAGSRAARREREWVRLCRTAAGERAPESRSTVESAPSGTPSVESAAGALAGEPEDAEPTIRLRWSDSAGEGSTGEAVAGAEGGSLAPLAGGSGPRLTEGSGHAEAGVWDPVPVPLPTYVTKAKAPRAVRTVNLGAPETEPESAPPEQAVTHQSAPEAGAASEAMPGAPVQQAAGAAGEESAAELVAEDLHRPAVGD